MDNWHQWYLYEWWVGPHCHYIELDCKAQSSPNGCLLSVDVMFTMSLMFYGKNEGAALQYIGVATYWEKKNKTIVADSAAPLKCSQDLPIPLWTNGLRVNTSYIYVTRHLSMMLHDTVKPTYNDLRYNDLSVTAITFQCIYDVPTQPIETASSYNEYFSKGPSPGLAILSGQAGI